MKTKESKKLQEKMEKRILKHVGRLFEKRKSGMYPAGISMYSSKTALIITSEMLADLADETSIRRIINNSAINLLNDGSGFIRQNRYLENGTAIIDNEKIQAPGFKIPESIYSDELKTSTGIDVEKAYLDDFDDDDDEPELLPDEERDSDKETPKPEPSFSEILEMLRNLSLTDREKDQVLDAIGITIDGEDCASEPVPVSLEKNEVTEDDVIEYIRNLDSDGIDTLINRIQQLHPDEIEIADVEDDMEKVYERSYLRVDNPISPEDNQKYMANVMTKFEEYVNESVSKNKWYSSSVFAELVKDAHDGHAPLEAMDRISRGYCKVSDYSFRRWRNNDLTKVSFKPAVYAIMIMAAFPESGYNTILNRLRHDAKFRPYPKCSVDKIPSIIDEIESNLRTFVKYWDAYGGKSNKDRIVSSSPLKDFMKITSADTEYGFIPDVVSPIRYGDLRTGDLFMIHPICKSKIAREKFVLNSSLDDVFVKLRHLSGDGSKTIIGGQDIVEYIVSKYNDKDLEKLIEYRNGKLESEDKDKVKIPRFDICLSKKYECIRIYAEYKDVYVEAEDVEEVQDVEQVETTEDTKNDGGESVNE